jgi:hypothetical protein
MAHVVSRRPLIVHTRFRPGSVRVGFVLDKVALGQVFLRVFFGFTLSVSFHRGFPYSYTIWEMGNRP